jgi:hypothetical protein
MNAGNLWFIIKLLPILALTAVIFTMLGWRLRRKFHAPVVSSGKPHAQDDLPARERVKKLEHALAKSDAVNAALKHDLESVQAKSVAKSSLDKAAKDLASALHRQEADQKRIQTIEADLRKSRETINTLNSTAAEINKGQQQRTFAIENELSKTREALAILEARPDNSLALHAEIDRLREALTNSTRVIGELRKQEAATSHALAKCQAQLDATTSIPAAAEAGPVSLLPAMEMAERKLTRSNNTGASDKVAAAMLEVERLHAHNAQKEAERLAAEQSERLAAEQAERLAAEQAERLAAEQAERLAAEQAERLAAEQAERLAAEQAERQAAEQAERLAAEQADRLAAEQAERLAAEQAERLAAADETPHATGDDDGSLQPPSPQTAAQQ